MRDFEDKELDHLLEMLEPPTPPRDLSTRIMNALPARKQSWMSHLRDLFGGQPLGIPASGALACLMVGLMVGYGPVSDLGLETDDAELLIADVLGIEQWDETIEELTQ